MAKLSLVLSAGLIVVTSLTKQPYIYILGLFALGYCYFRVMSKNIAKRQVENLAFSNFFRKMGRTIKDVPWKTKARFTELGRRIRYGSNTSQQKRQEKKLYRFFVCPSCGQKVRVPRGKGKIEITCPKCSATFIKKS